MNDKKRKIIVSVILIVVVLAYLILPFDIIPDIAVGAGQIDDGIVAVLGVVLGVVNLLVGKETPNSKNEEPHYDDINYREL